MILKRRVALNGVWLDEVDSRIAVSSVEPGDGRENISAVDAAAGYGSRITGERRQTVDMTVRFRIQQKGHTEAGQQARAEILEAVNAWAAMAADGAYMTVNYKPNRRLNVKLVQAPGEGSLWDYTKEFTITFRAYTIPYWEQETANSQIFGGSAASSSRAFQVEGSAKTQIDCEIANTSGMAIQSLSATVDGKTMSFSSLGLAGGETLVIDHDRGLVRIRIRSAGGAYRSAMAARTGANDFMVAPGSRTASYSAQRACRMTVSWRARYL